MAENLFHRRSLRIQGADYTEPGAYFITICAADRKSIFGEIANEKVLLTQIGQLVRDCWAQIPDHFAQVFLKEFVVMPNHLHGIFGLNSISQAADGIARPVERFQRPVKGSLPTIIRSFKAAVTRRSSSILRMYDQRIWQSNYFERVIRNGQQYAMAARYIVENPERWEWDAFNPLRRERSIEMRKSDGRPAVKSALEPE